MYETIYVRDWMTKEVVTVTPDSLLAEAHQIMKRNEIRRLIVIGEKQEVIGIITIGDVRQARPSDVTTLSIWEMNYLWSQLTIKKIMTRDPFTTTPDTPIIDVAEMMYKHKVSGLPVLDDGKLVGVITESDIFKMLIAQRGEKDPFEIVATNRDDAVSPA